MRKLLWSGVAALVVGAVAVYVAYDHARQHPMSVLGRCATAAATFGLTGNPVEAVRNLQGVPCDALQVGELAKPGDEKEVLPPVPDAEEFPPVHEAEEVINIEPGARLDVPEEYAIDKEWEQWYDDSESPVMPEVGTEEGTEENSASGTEESYPLQLCVPMQEPEAGTSSEAIWSIEMIGVGTVRDLLKLLRCHGEDACASGDEDDCGWLLRLLGFGRLMDESAEQPMTESEPMPASEEATEEMPMRDPDYHRYHYHGCPYSGCPYPHAYTPPVYTPPVTTPVPTPAPAPEAKPTRKPRRGCGESQMSFWQRLMSLVQDPSGPANVDTMECRPSDIHREPRMPHFPF